MHHDAAEIEADFELSERLGAELLAAGCEPLPAEVKVITKTHYLVPTRRVNLLTGVSSWTLESV